MCVRLCVCLSSINKEITEFVTTGGRPRSYGWPKEGGDGVPQEARRAKADYLEDKGLPLSGTKQSRIFKH